MVDILEKIDRLAAAEGVIFDLRGYPAFNDDVLRFLTEEPLRSAHWMTPEIIFPDHRNIAGWYPGERWLIEPVEPRIMGKVVFLTDARAISYAESVMGIVEAYNLGEIVGRPTAGANGNVNPIELPGGWTIFWTGMKVLKHDGSQHHLVGIQPTVLVERTVEAIRQGRDEDIETALSLIRQIGNSP